MVGIDTLERDRHRAAPGFGERRSPATEWTVRRIVVVSSKLQQRFEPRWERWGVRAAIHQGAHADGDAPALVHEAEDLVDRASCGHDILDDYRAFPGLDLLRSAEREDPIGALGEQRAHTERARDLVGNNDPAHGGGDDHLWSIESEPLRERTTDNSREVGMLEQQRALDISRTMQPGAEGEMARLQGICTPQERLQVRERATGSQHRPLPSRQRPGREPGWDSLPR